MRTIALVRDGRIRRILTVESIDDAYYAGRTVDITDIDPQPQVGWEWNAGLGAFEATGSTDRFNAYTWKSFLAKGFGRPAVQQLFIRRGDATPGGADAEMFLRWIEANDGIDFNLKESRLRLGALVGDALTAAQARAIRGGS